MKRRRPFMLVIALLMLLTSMLSTETVEVWCRATLGASAGVDDDDGPYFIASPVVAGGSTQSNGAAAAVSSRTAIPQVTASDKVVDEPTYCLPTFDVLAAPAQLDHVWLPASVQSFNIETRGPPAQVGNAVRPPPRAPPVS